MLNRGVRLLVLMPLLAAALLGCATSQCENAEAMGGEAMLESVSAQSKWTLKLKRFDFRPQDGAYDMNRSGPPRHDLTFAATERYDLDVELVNPAPAAFGVAVDVQNDISWWPDDTVGGIWLEFDRGARVPRLIRYQNSAGLPEPAGAPPEG